MTPFFFSLALVASGCDEDKGERSARLTVAVLIDASASQSNKSPGLMQALVKEPRPGAAKIIIPTRLFAPADPR